MIILIALLVLIAMMATPLLYAWKHRNDTSVVELEESEWYDENGNHIYYDRKLIRYLEKTARKRAVRRKSLVRRERKPPLL